MERVSSWLQRSILDRESEVSPQEKREGDTVCYGIVIRTEPKLLRGQDPVEIDPSTSKPQKILPSLAGRGDKSWHKGLGKETGGRRDWQTELSWRKGAQCRSCEAPWETTVQCL